MKDNKFIQETIQLRIKDNDPVKEYSTRNKASPINVWSEFKPYSKQIFNEVYTPEIDGLKLKFKSTTLIINGRHNLFL